MAKKNSALKGGVGTSGGGGPWTPPSVSAALAAGLRQSNLGPGPDQPRRSNAAYASRLNAQAASYGMYPYTPGAGGTPAAAAPKPKRDRSGPVVTKQAVAPWKSTTYSLDGAPAWWQGFTPQTLTPDRVYLGLINNVIPYLSPEDQQAMAGSLYRADPDTFSSYNPEDLNVAIPAGIGTPETEQYASQRRGEAVLSALAKFAAATGNNEAALGPGYKYLRSLADNMRDFGGSEGSGQTRAEAAQQRAALDPLFAEGKSPDLAAFEPIARALALPFFSAGQLSPVTKSVDGSYIFGAANAQLY